MIFKKLRIFIPLAIIGLAGAFCVSELSYLVESHTEQQTCYRCGSIRQIRKDTFFQIPFGEGDEVLQYKSDGYEDCNHGWRLGLSQSVRTPIRTGQIILVYQEGVYGAFRFTMQKANQNYGEIEYDWWYRSDGESGLDPSDPLVDYGHEVYKPTLQDIGNYPVRFGRFQIAWSQSSDGLGWIYYSRAPLELISTQDLRICVTDLASPLNLDGADPQWQYKASPTDPPAPAPTSSGD